MQAAEEIVNRPDRRRAVSDREGNTLGRTATAVAGGEHAGKARLGDTWWSQFFPNGTKRDLGPRYQVALFVLHDGGGQEIGPRLCSYENEEAGCEFFTYFTIRFAYVYAANLIGSLDSDDFGVIADSDSFVRQKPLRQVGRHFSQVRATHQQRYLVRGF